MAERAPLADLRGGAAAVAARSAARYDPNRGRRFGQALVLAHELPADVGVLYAHYLHTPASVARYAAVLRGLPWCASAHAKDIWTTPAWEKAEKLRDCAWATTCTATGAAHLRALAPGAEVMLTYHGLDASRFAAPQRTRGPDGTDPRRPVRLLGVARLVPKKGIEVLLEALAALPPELHWRYEHVGAGPLREALAAAAARLGLAERVIWRGALPQEEVIAAYRAADLFVLASRIAPDGDRDGLPNVLLEAGAMELPVVASGTAGGLGAGRGRAERPARAAGRPCRARGGARGADPRSCRPPAPRSRRAAPGAGAVRRRARHRPAGGAPGRRAGPDRAGGGMRGPVAFYAPLKPPDHPVPSGDRRMARALIAALALADLPVELASRLRSYDRDGDALRQRRIEALGGRIAARLARRYAAAARRRSARAPGSPTTLITSRPTGSAPP